MGFTRITNADMNGKGAMSLPNQPTISAPELKRKFDEPAKEVVTPKFNNLIDELEATGSAQSLGASAPTGRTGTTIQGVLNSISSDLTTVEGQSHTHTNKTVIDKFDDDGTGLTYDGSPISGAVDSVNGKTGTVVLTASDVGALPSSTTIPTKTSDLTNDSSFVTTTDLNTGLSGKVDKVSGKGLSTNDYDNTAKGIVDGVTAALATKSTVTYSQTYTSAGQKIGEITIDGVKTDVVAPTGGGGGGGGAVDSVNGQTGTVVLTASDVGALPSSTTIPSKVSELTNDSGFQTSSDVSTAISTAIGALDGTVSGSAGAGKTLTAFSETDGKVSATFGDISITKSQISDFPTIPTVNDGQLSISVNGSATTFTANQSANSSVSFNIPVWHTNSVSGEGVVNNNQVTFYNINSNYAYDLYCDGKLLGISAVNTATSGQVTYTVTGASNNDQCYLLEIRS